MLKRLKSPIRRILPSLVRHALRDLLEDLRDCLDTFAFGLRFVATRTPRPKMLLYFGYAPGDDLLCTAVMRELRKRGRDGLLMISDHRELFEGNQDPAYVRPLWARYSPDSSTVSICRRFVQIWGGEFTRTRICANGRQGSAHTALAPYHRRDVRESWGHRPSPHQAIPDVGREGDVTCSLGKRPYRHPK